MATGSPDRLTVTSEFFLEPLGLSALPDALPERKLELFAAIVEDLYERGLADPVAPASQTPGGSEMNLMIPGTAVHVQLSAINDPQVDEIIQTVMALQLHHLQGIVLSLAGLRRLSRLFSQLKTEYGERSVVEALRGTRPPTAQAIAGILHGASCRHPTAGCRFMSADGACGISTKNVADTLDSLATRNVLVVKNATEPYEYKVSI